MTITSGRNAKPDGKGGALVPKKELVRRLKQSFGSGRLKVASDLPEAEVLVKELQNFEVRVTEAGNETFGAWKQGTHDDLVLAVALAIWGGECTSTA